MTVEFKSPPTRAFKQPGAREGNINWNVIFIELRDNPGAWAHVATAKTEPSAQVWASHIRTGNRAGCEAGEFESVHDGVAVYARYVGEV